MNNAAKTEAVTETLQLGHRTSVEDGVYFSVAEWSGKARDYLDIPGLYTDEIAAREKRGTMMAGTTRTVRYTVHQGSVMTRRGLR